MAVISLSVVIGLSAMFLVERIVPAIDKIVKENAFSIDAAINMLDAISANDHLNHSQNLESKFWTSFQAANKNTSIAEEQKILAEIKDLGVLYWAGNSNELEREQLSTYITSLAKLKLQDMQVKDDEAQFMGLAGAWAIGILLLLSISIQLYFRHKTIATIIHPVEDLLRAMESFACGNRQRRFLVNPDAVKDLRKLGQLTNDFLDDLCKK